MFPAAKRRAGLLRVGDLAPAEQTVLHELRRDAADHGPMALSHPSTSSHGSDPAAPEARAPSACCLGRTAETAAPQPLRFL